VRARILLLDVAHGALPCQLEPGQGPAPGTQPVPNLRRMRSPTLLLEVRTRFLCHVPQAVPTERGKEKVVAVDIFRERVFLRSIGHGPRIVPLVALREEIEQAREKPRLGGTTASEPAATPSNAAPVPPGAPSPPPAPTEANARAPAADTKQSGAQPSEQRSRRRRRGRGRRRGRRRDKGPPPESPPTAGD
jgi:hypothetical protein